MLSIHRWKFSYYIKKGLQTFWYLQVHHPKVHSSFDKVALKPGQLEVTNGVRFGGGAKFSNFSDVI